MSDASKKTPLDRDDPRPLYVQLYSRLRAQIQRGAWEAGAMIPAESEIGERYGVSRITVRAALDQMVRDGLVERMRGRGSFVRSLAPETRACLTSLTEQVIRSGRTPTTDVLGVTIDVARAFAEDDLPFAADARIARVERVRRIDGQRVALMRSFLPEHVVPGIVASDFAEAGPAQSLLYVLEHRFGVILDQGEETLVPTGAAPRDADPLGIAPGTPVAVKICRIEDASGVTTLYEEAIWCAAQTQPIQRFPEAAMTGRKERERHLTGREMS